MKKNIIKNNTWVLVDVKDKVLGRIASKIALILVGKNNITFNYNHIIGNQVIIINADKIKVSGNKVNNKIYYKHSGYPGGLKLLKYKDMFLKNPSFVIKNAIKGMLPKNKLRKLLLNRVRIYSGVEHPHSSQKPDIINL